MKTSFSRIASIALLAIAACAAAPDSRAAQASRPVTQRVGDFAVTLRLPSDGVYAGEESEIEFRIVDMRRDDPVLGPPGVIRATVESLITMPAMPGMPSQTETAHAEGVPGEYGIHPVFAHGGEYLVRVKVSPPGATPFNVEFPIAVKDADASRASRPKPFILQVSAKPSRPVAGEPVALHIEVHDTKTDARISSFDVAHEKLLHLMIIRDDLGTFSHEHPEIQGDGSFTLSYTFPTEGRFRLFADIAPKGRGSQVISSDIDVRAPKGGGVRAPFALDASKPKISNIGGVVATLSTTGELVTQSQQTLAVNLTDAVTGAPVTNLDPYLGAMGHMVLVSQDGSAFVHSHPDEAVWDATRNGTITFSARFAKPGLYRCWAQFQRGGKVITTDFVVSVKEPGR